MSSTEKVQSGKTPIYRLLDNARIFTDDDESDEGVRKSSSDINGAAATTNRLGGYAADVVTQFNSLALGDSYLTSPFVDGQAISSESSAQVSIFNQPIYYRCPYIPLHEGRLFRLMHLLPGTGNEPIRIELFLSRIEDAQSYKAISYVWGNQQDTRQIFHRNDVIHIPTNLYNALHHFRRPDTYSTLWADSICINQQDKMEKGHQVNYMGLIFEAAESVLAWLGDDHSATTEEALRFVETSVERWYTEIGSSKACRNIQRALQKINPPSQSDLHLQLDAINAIITNGYFKRVWILQEVALAKTVIVCCGASHIKLSTLVTFCKTLFLTRKSASNPKLNGRINDLFDNIWSTFGTSRSTTWINESPILLRLANLAREGRLNSGFIRDFASILNAAGKLETSDPRDQVYALLKHPWATIKGSNRSIIRAKYSMDMPKLNHTLAVRLCSKGQSLSHLRAVNHSDPESLLENASDPSWVTQWGIQPTTASLVRGFKDPILRREGMSQFQVHIEGGKQLHAVGLIVDRITFPASPPFLQRDPDDSTVRRRNGQIFDESWNLLISGCGIQVQQLVSLFVNHGHEKFSDSSVKILMHLLEFLERKCRYKIGEAIRRHWQSEIEELVTKGIRGNVALFFERIFKHYTTRKYFVTAHKRVGLGPRLLQEGDLCCALFGCDAILVIRPTSIPQQFKLVGGCIIAGLMGGEIGSLWQQKRLRKQNIIII